MTPKQLDEVLPRLQVLARSSPDDKHLLVTRLNGTALPRDRDEWEEQHPELNWETDRDRALPGYWEEVSMHVRVRVECAVYACLYYKLRFFVWSLVESSFVSTGHASN